MKEAVIHFSVICLLWVIIVVVWWGCYRLMRRLDREDASALAARDQVVTESAPSYEEAVGQQQPTVDPEPPSYDESRMNRRRRRRHRSSRHDQLSDGNNMELQDMGVGGVRNGEDDNTANAGASVASTAAAGNVTTGTSSSDSDLEKSKSSKRADLHSPN